MATKRFNKSELKKSDLTNLPFKNISQVQKEIEEAKVKSKAVKLELLKHILLNYSLYENLKDSEKEFSSIKEKIIEMGVLFEKVCEMESNILVKKVENKVEKAIIENKEKKNKKSVTPREAYAKKAKNLEEKVKKRFDDKSERKSKKLQ